jgi:chromosome segregation ATPase
MEDLRRESDRIKRENEACKARIAELEADLSQLLKERRTSLTDSNVTWTGSPADGKSRSIPSDLASPNAHGSLDDSNCSRYSGINSRHAIDVSARAAEQQRVLSATQLENAKLKQSIAEREAANAELTIELHAVKSTLQELQAIPSATGILEDLQNQLSERDDELEKARRHIQELKSELRRTKTDAQAQEESRREEHRKELQKFRASYDDLAQENESLKAELEHLHVKCEELSEAVSYERTKKSELVAHKQEIQRLTNEVAQLRKEKVPAKPEPDFRRTAARLAEEKKSLQERLIQITAQFSLRFDTFEAATANKVDRLEGQLTNFALAWGRIAGLQPAPSVLDGNDLFGELSRGIKSMEQLTQAYANSGCVPVRSSPRHPPRHED